MRLIMISLVVLVTGCTVLPENIQIADEEQLVSYEHVVATGDATLTKPARWGGLIAELESDAAGSLVEVISFPLDQYGKPDINSGSSGRFKVKMDTQLDPSVFESGRVITFTGTVDEATEAVNGEQVYVYPTLAGNSFHFWEQEALYDVNSIGFRSGVIGFGDTNNQDQQIDRRVHGGFYSSRFIGRGFYGNNRFGIRQYGPPVRVIRGTTIIQSRSQNTPETRTRRNSRINTSPFRGRRSVQKDKLQ